MDPQWPAADFDVEEQKRRLADEVPVYVIPTVGVTRYVTPLREGGSLPGIVEADDLGTYVCKFRGAGQGVRVLVAEVIVAGLAERIGLRTPRLVALDLDPEIARYEADEEVQDLLNASPGLNLGADFLPGSFGFDGHVPPGRGERSADPARVLWLDAFVANVDRSWRNPNLLLWHGNLWVIDHGAALYFHHGWAGGVGDPSRFAEPGLERRRPRLPRARRRAARRRRRAPRLPGRSPSSPRCWPRCPTSGSSRCPAPRTRTRCARRTSTSSPPASAPPSGYRRWRHERDSKLSYEYVVLRCVPRVDREEFLNVGVVLHCQMADFLDVALARRPRPAAGPRPARSTSTRSASPWPSSRRSAPATRPPAPRPPSR